jgi:acetyl esterase/lipase
MKLWIAAAALLAATPALAQQRLPLYPDGAPGSEARKGEPEQAQDYWVKNIHDPSITAYLPDPAKANGAAVVIAPGGGHRLLVINGEGVDTARYFNSLGVAAFVLKYRLAREDGSTYSIERDAKADTIRAMRLVRDRATRFGLDPKRIGLMGFSAGGELVSMVANATPEELAAKDSSLEAVDLTSARPDFQILVYPGPLGIPAAIPKSAPPAFLIAASDDACCSGPVIDLMTRFRAAGVPNEVHLYARGGHAFNMGGARTEVPGLKNWPARLTDWLQDSGLLTKK